MKNEILEIFEILKFFEIFEILKFFENLENFELNIYFF
jgi:hypothetical protein